jgi:hypothetical protein
MPFSAWTPALCASTRVSGPVQQDRESSSNVPTLQPQVTKGPAPRDDGGIGCPAGGPHPSTQRIGPRHGHSSSPCSCLLTNLERPSARSPRQEVNQTGPAPGI